jgi:hypothetical protein
MGVKRRIITHLSLDGVCVVWYAWLSLRKIRILPLRRPWVRGQLTFPSPPSYMAMASREIFYSRNQTSTPLCSFLSLISHFPKNFKGKLPVKKLEIGEVVKFPFMPPVPVSLYAVCTIPHIHMCEGDDERELLQRKGRGNK